MRRFLALLPLLFLALSAERMTAAPADTARFAGIGGIVIFSNNPDSLANWYATKFGLATPMKESGSHYGTIPSADGPIHFGITPFPTGSPVRTGGAMGFVLRVNDYDGFLNDLKRRGLEPAVETTDGVGRFAAFVDPDGNGISIWGR